MSTKLTMTFVSNDTVDLDSIVNGENLNDLVNKITLHQSFSDNLKEKIIAGITDKMDLIQNQDKPVRVATVKNENVLVERV